MTINLKLKHESGLAMITIAIFLVIGAAIFYLYSFLQMSNELKENKKHDALALGNSSNLNALAVAASLTKNPPTAMLYQDPYYPIDPVHIAFLDATTKPPEEWSFDVEKQLFTFKSKTYADGKLQPTKIESSVTFKRNVTDTTKPFLIKSVQVEAVSKPIVEGTIKNPSTVVTQTRVNPMSIDLDPPPRPSSCEIQEGLTLSPRNIPIKLVLAGTNPDYFPMTLSKCCQAKVDLLFVCDGLISQAEVKRNNVVDNTTLKPFESDPAIPYKAAASIKSFDATLGKMSFNATRCETIQLTAWGPAGDSSSHTVNLKVNKCPGGPTNCTFCP